MVEAFLKEQHARYNLGHVPFQAYLDRFIELDDHGYAEKQMVFRVLIGEFSVPATTGELVADFRRNAWKNCRMFPGALDVLRQLRRRGYKLGIITNGSVESQAAKLHESGLARLVDVALISERERIRKPDPRIFDRAAESLGVRAEECVFVGDNPEADVVGSLSAGMTAIWVEGSLSWPENLTTVPTHTVRSLTELLALEFSE